MKLKNLRDILLRSQCVKNERLSATYMEFCEHAGEIEIRNFYEMAGTYIDSEYDLCVKPCFEI